ncbi:MAG TPA: hypothetical protein VFE58_17730 [Tepidisphaeraceae bacterium]|jgi:hypothetical protein|nr:hypothetical protein [Tepidisphaeraceae bacterium]
MTNLQSSLPSADFPPDWSTTTDELLCPLCSYNLRGLTTPRCPECGYSFTWSALAEARHHHRYLFEHHPRHDAWSFFRTFAATLLPTRFWRSLTPFHQVRPGRLLTYWLLILHLTVMVPLCPFLLYAYQDHQDYLTARAARLNFMTSTFQNANMLKLQSSLLQQFGSAQAFANQTVPIPPLRNSFVVAWHKSHESLFFFACYAAWPAMTVAAMSLYRRSTRQASIRNAQVARCAIYSEDAGAWLGLILLPITAYTAWTINASMGSHQFARRFTQILAMAPGGFWFLIFLIGTYRLTRAYSQYLKMKRAWLAIPLAQLIILLVYAELHTIIFPII